PGVRCFGKGGFMKRILTVLSIIAALVVGTAVIAQEKMNREGEEIIEALQLTPAQASVFQSAHDEFRATTAPLREKQRSIGRQIESQLKANSGDACTLGNELIAQQAVNTQIKAAHDALKSKIAAVLTPEQKSKFDAIATMHERHGMMEHHE